MINFIKRRIFLIQNLGLLMPIQTNNKSPVSAIYLFLDNKFIIYKFVIYVFTYLFLDNK